MNQSICIHAPAKINVGLDVVRRLDNGYHEVKMIMQTIRLYDQITLTRIPEKQDIQLETNLRYLPTNENNLAYRAAKLLKEEFHIDGGMHLALSKRIPVAAGMAGGSADAAATLIAVNRLYQLGLSEEDLMKRGVTLGADIPYCIKKGTCLSEGIGEKLTELPPFPDCYILIAKPNIHVSTSYVYEHLVLNEKTHHPDIDGMIRDIQSQSLSAICKKCKNVLEQVTIEEYPEIARLKTIMLEQGALGSLMSGSGPSVFGIFTEKTAARRAQRACQTDDRSHFVFLTTPYLADRDFHKQ